MSTPPTRFLHRRNYRRRRMADAARMLPVAGAVLLMIPLLVTPAQDGTGGARTAAIGLFIFGVWALLIAVAYGLSRGLRDEDAMRRPRPPRAGVGR